MVGKLVRSEIAQRKLIILAVEALHFESSITRFIKSGSKCSLGCPGGTYKLLRGYPSHSLRLGDRLLSVGYKISKTA